MPLMQEDPLFSVVIPAYNAEKFVCKALDSVTDQTISDYEVVVVDDGSTDGTSRKITSWAKEHPLVKLRLIQQANKGIGGARNAGIRHANGVFVAFLDSDDFWLGKKLEFVADHIKANPSVDMICHDEWLQTDKAGKKRLTYGPYATYRDLLFNGNCISTSATVVRRQKILEVGGFSEDMQFNSVEDYDLWLRLARADCCIEYLHKILGVYRVWGQGVTNNIALHNQHAMNVLDAHFRRWQPKNLYYRYLIRQRRAGTLRGGGHAFMKQGDHREAQKYFCMAIEQDPLNWKTWVLILLY
jgi:glycosyltransferase involved in cell wall biosynthesis